MKESTTATYVVAWFPRTIFTVSFAASRANRSQSTSAGCAWERAAQRLRMEETPVIDLALDAGYESHEVQTLPPMRAALVRQSQVGATWGKLMSWAGMRGLFGPSSCTYDQLFGAWLPRSGREVRDEPAFEVYLNSPLNTSPQDLLTIIHVPVA